MSRVQIDPTSIALLAAAISGGAGDGAAVPDTGGVIVSVTGVTPSGGDVSFDALNDAIVIDTAGFGALSLDVAGTWVGTLQVQYGDKLGQYTQSAQMTYAANAGNGADGGNITFNQLFQSNTLGRYARIIMTAWTSGAAVVTPRLHTARFPARSIYVAGGVVQGVAANGAAVNPNPITVGGYDGANIRSLSVTGSGGLNVVAGGNLASGAADTGNPIKIGGKYNSTLPTFSDGQRGDLQIGARGAVLASLYSIDGNSLTAVGPFTDGNTNGSYGLATLSKGQVFNGTTWDRMRGDVNGSYVQQAVSTRFFSDSTSSLGSSATFTGTSRDTTILTAGFTGQAYFNAFARADVAGTLRIEASNDNSTWVQVTKDADGAVAAGSLAYLQVPIVFRYYRVKYVNAAGAQAGFNLNSSFTAA